MRPCLRCELLAKLSVRAQQRDYPATMFHPLERLSEHVLTHHIQYDIDLLDHICNRGSCVIDDDIGSQLPHKRDIARRGGGDDLRSLPFGELDGEMAHATSSTRNEHGLPLLQPCCVEERLPGRQRRHRDSSGLLMGEMLRLAR